MGVWIKDPTLHLQSIYHLNKPDILLETGVSRVQQIGDNLLGVQIKLGDAGKTNPGISYTNLFLILRLMIKTAL